jgi:hypothetical protein
MRTLAKRRELISASGTKLPSPSVGSSIAIGGKPDMGQTTQFGRQ